MSDDEGRRVYGFFSTHLDCEWLVGVLGHGLGMCPEGMSYPGWLPDVLEGMGVGELGEIEGWEGLSVLSRRKFLLMGSRVGLTRRQKKGQPRLEYRYYDSGTRERSCFKATLDQVRRLVGQE